MPHAHSQDRRCLTYYYCIRVPLKEYICLKSCMDLVILVLKICPKNDCIPNFQWVLSSYVHQPKYLHQFKDKCDLSEISMYFTCHILLLEEGVSFLHFRVLKLQQEIGYFNSGINQEFPVNCVTYVIHVGFFPPTSSFEIISKIIRQQVIVNLSTPFKNHNVYSLETILEPKS